MKNTHLSTQFSRSHRYLYLLNEEIKNGDRDMEGGRIELSSLLLQYTSQELDRAGSLLMLRYNLLVGTSGSVLWYSSYFSFAG